MNQQGLISFVLLIGLLILSGAGIAGTLYVSKNIPNIITPSPAPIDSSEFNSSNFTRSTLNLQQSINTGKTTYSSPSPLASVRKPAATPTPKPAATSLPVRTSAPTTLPTPVPTIIQNSCDINVIYGKMNGGASDPLLVTLVYSFNTRNGSYMTGAQWDFDGNGTWDTDLKQLNGTMEHTYPQAGTYTPRLQLQASDGSMTEVCRKSFTVSSGITIKLTGKVYADVNCNNFPEPSENGVAGATVMIDKMPEYSTYATLTTDSSGNYNFSQNIQPNAYLSLSPSSGPVPSGYKSNPNFKAPTFALNSTQSSINVDIPLVPYENVGTCQY